MAVCPNRTIGSGQYPGRSCKILPPGTLGHTTRGQALSLHGTMRIIPQSSIKGRGRTEYSFVSRQSHHVWGLLSEIRFPTSLLESVDNEGVAIQIALFCP